MRNLFHFLGRLRGTETSELIAGDDPLARIHRMNPYTAVVTWEPTPEQQTQLAGKGLHGQLHIQYDVDREQHPQQIVVIFSQAWCIF